MLLTRPKLPLLIVFSYCLLPKAHMLVLRLEEDADEQVKTCAVEDGRAMSPSQCMPIIHDVFLQQASMCFRRWGIWPPWARRGFAESVVLWL